MGPLLDRGKKRIGIAAVALFLLLPSPSMGEGRGEGDSDLITPLLPLLATGDLGGAITELETQAASPSSSAPANSIHLLAGILSFRQGDFPRALLHFEQAKNDSSPISDHIALWHAKTLNRLEHFREAASTLAPLIPVPLPTEKSDRESSPIEAEIYWETVRAQIGLKEWGEALRLIGARTENRKKDPDDEIRAEFFEGLILWKQGSTGAAENVWKKILLDAARHPLEEEILELYNSREINPLSYLSREDWLARADNLADRGA